MRLSSFFLMIGLAQAQIYNYVIDSSCDTNSYPKAQDAAKEAILMAKNAATRINDMNDQVTERLFQTVFKKSRAEEKGPLNVFTSIGNFLKTSLPSSASSSALRIFCDNDDRWVEKENVDGKKYLFDPHTGIAREVSRTPSCKKTDKAVAGVTYSTADPIRKSSITLCNTALKRSFVTVDAFKQTGSKSFATPDGFTIDNYNFISRTVLHELTHAWPNRLKDRAPAYRWENIISKDAANAKLNSDSHAYFGLISYLGGHKLSDNAADRQKGRLVQSTSLARRDGLPARCRDLKTRRGDKGCVEVLGN
ncbi:hypothetical protein GQ43DRAFT_483826 [Delitschia confertaspora ATCC 74209]|uniref:Lysine-specific metallo-endopeptidase domain-containing protein n=1 Tax=Delitschia confertaspora ATCC 74209 TaxID=1513339 RepID=A0A9P4MPD1_9PLEO|nr:hypothetical protein GQ43DRAFT_483826 [Delitschia confertaspora ATCC 74209]